MSRRIENNTRTVCILASEAYLPQLRVSITSIQKHFGSKVDVNVGWFGDSLPMLPKGVLVHKAEGSNWLLDIGETREQILASRPGFVKFLMKECHYNQILHVGADMVFYSTADWVFDTYKEDDAAACPHSCAPYPNKEGVRPMDLQVHLTGQLNSDFVLYNAYKDTVDFLDWQIARHADVFGVDLANGYFFDQVWLSFLPYYTNCKIIKDPRLNVAYYNLHERSIIRTGPDTYWVQLIETPNLLYQLVCFQFSGFDTHKLSKYNLNLELLTKDVVQLSIEYKQKLEGAGWVSPQ